MVDLEMNEQSSLSESLAPLIQCNCEDSSFGEFCESCLKYNHGDSDISSISSLPVTRDPVITANFLMFLTVVLNSANAVVIREFLVMGGPPEMYLFVRCLISFPCYILLTYGIKLNKYSPLMTFHESRSVNLVMFGGCLAGAVRQSLLPFILSGTEASTIGILSPSVPIFTAIVCHLLGLEKITFVTVFCLFLTTLGLFLGLDIIEKFNKANKLAYDFLLLIPLSKSFQVIFLKMSSEYFESATILKNQVAVSLLVAFPVSVVTSIFKCDGIKEGFVSLFNFNYKQFLCCTYSVVAILIIGWRLQIHCLKVIGANVVSFYQTLRPFFTILMSAFFLGEHLTLKKIVGTVIVCSAVFIYQKYRVRPSERH